MNFAGDTHGGVASLANAGQEDRRPTLSSRTDKLREHLQEALLRARARLENCRAELVRYEAAGGGSERLREKLEGDIRDAENDVAWLSHELEGND